MRLMRTCASGCLAMLLAACGGSGSETPPPVEPTSPGSWSDREDPKAGDTEPAKEEEPAPKEVAEDPEAEEPREGEGDLEE